MNLRVCLSIVCLTQLLGSTVTANHASKPSETRSSSVAMTSMALPVRFERNDGQTDPRVRFVSRGRGYTLFLTSQAMVLASGGPSRSAVRIDSRSRQIREPLTQRLQERS
jgi:hypothetical protein